MDESDDTRVRLDGEIVAVLLDQQEYPSKVGNVAAVSSEQLCFLKKDKHELVGYRLELHDINDCKAIEYRDQMVYYRVAIAVVCFVLAAMLAIMLATGFDTGAQDVTPLIIGAIACLTLGVRFVTSTHRHIINFEMPGQVLTWRSPAIDYKYKAEAAHAVRAFARERGLLREGNP